MKFVLQYLSIIFLLIPIRSQDRLSTVILNNMQTTGFRFANNYVGLTFNFSQILTAMQSTIFTGYVANSRAFGSTYASFSISFKNQYPKGYKYNCGGYTSMGINITCAYDYQSIISRINTFVRATVSYLNAGFVMGFDNDGAKYTDANFQTYLTSFLAALQTNLGSGSYRIPVELFDEANNFGVNNVVLNYTSQNFVNDMKTFLPLYGYNIFYGPGLT